MFLKRFFTFCLMFALCSCCGFKLDKQKYNTIDIQKNKTLLNGSAVSTIDKDIIDKGGVLINIDKGAQMKFIGNLKGDVFAGYVEEQWTAKRDMSVFIGKDMMRQSYISFDNRKTFKKWYKAFSGDMKLKFQGDNIIKGSVTLNKREDNK